MTVRLRFSPERPNRRFEEDGKTIGPGETFTVSENRAEELLEDHADVLKPVARKDREQGKTDTAASTSAQSGSTGTAAQQTGAST